MALDPTMQQMFDNQTAAGQSRNANFWDAFGQGMAAAVNRDSRQLGAFTDGKLFNQDVQEIKTAYATPIGPTTPPAPPTAAH